MVLVIIAIVKHRKFQHLFLLATSLFFFYYSSNYLIILIIFTIFWDFYFGLMIYKANTKKSKKILFVSSLAGNLGLLGFFKYTDFIINQFNDLASFFNLESIELLNLALPIGISFYTFHSITYTVGIYRGRITPVRLREYALFVVFFPQLVAGPILRAHEFLPQLREKLENMTSNSIRQIIIENQNFKLGITMMAFGFFKKMFFADNISPLVNDVFINPLGMDSLLIILGTIGFGIQIYCDFSGYSDIAIGAAMILGFKLPINFNKPYFSSTPSDFWRRWHISLSTWLRDYLYIPLGGNKKSSSWTYFNLFAVMFLGGLWHGASWNFVIWGMLHGLYLAIHRICVINFPNFSTNSFFKSKLGKIFSIFIVQYLVFLAWIPFRVENFEHMKYSMIKYVVLDIQFEEFLLFLSEHKVSAILIIVFSLLHYVSYKKNILKTISNFKSFYWFTFLLFTTLLILLFYDGNPEKFIYFKF